MPLSRINAEFRKLEEQIEEMKRILNMTGTGSKRRAEIRPVILRAAELLEQDHDEERRRIAKALRGLIQ